MSEDTEGRYIKELATYLRGHFTKQKELIREMRELRALLHTVDVPEDYKTTTKVVRTPILADMIQRVTATLTVNYPTWRRGPLGERSKDQTNSSLIESWLLAAHRKMEQQARRRTFRMIMDAAIADGIGVCQYGWDPTAWSPFPRRSQNEKGDYEEEADPYLQRVSAHVRSRRFPFSWKDIDPLTYYFWDSYDNQREVVLIETVPLAPTARALGVYRDSAGKAWLQQTPGQPVPENTQISGDTVELTQHWTASTATYLLDQEPAKIVKHNWGRLPFFDFAGLSTHERSPERAYLPVAFAFKELIPFLDRLLTMKANWMYLSAFPRAVFKLAQGRLNKMMSLLPQDQQSRGRQLSQNLAELNSLLVLYEDESFAFAAPPPVGGDLNQLIQLTMGMIEAAGIGQVMRGEAPGNDSSGYLANQLMTAARLAYDPITDNCRFLLHDGAEFLLYGVDKLAKAAVPVWGDDDEQSAWLELASKHLDGIYDTEPKLEPLLPSNYIMEGQFGLVQQQGGAISMYTHRDRFLHLPSPEEEEKRIMVERIKSSPVIQDRLTEQVMKDAGLTPPPAPAPNPAAALINPQGEPLLPGAQALQGKLPVTPGLGMPFQPVPPQGSPALPQSNGLPGQGATGQPGGNFGHAVVTNAGQRQG